MEKEAVEQTAEIMREWPVIAIVLVSICVIAGLFMRIYAMITKEHSRVTASSLKDFKDVITETNKRMDAKDAANASLIKEMGDSCHAVQRETTARMTASLDKASDMMGRVSAALEWHERNRQQNPQRPTTERQV